jgi:hypothetical protein
MQTLSVPSIFLLLICSCEPDSEDKTSDFTGCNRVEMHIADEDDPVDLVVTFDDQKRPNHIEGHGGEGDELDLALTYDADGIIDNANLGTDFDIAMDEATKKITFVRIGGQTTNGLIMTFVNDRIVSSQSYGEDGAGVETTQYLYDNTGNISSIGANIVDAGDNVVGTIDVVFSYDTAHEPIFSTVPFLQSYASYSVYLLPFGITTKNIPIEADITFKYKNTTTVENRLFNYAYNEDNLVTSVNWSTSATEFYASFIYRCN